MRKALLLLFSLLILLTLAIGQVKVPAFPGAEGAGMYTSGGRGGDVYYVTTLEDSGPGSLREGVKLSNVNILFKVSGTIFLKSKLDITGSNITIAGQTAPGDGITIAGHGVEIKGNNIIIRYLRFRPGSMNLKDEPDALTAIGKGKIKNIILDHISCSWSVDEALSVYQVENMTVQWSIISESLTMSGHEKGRHGYGGIWGGINATFHHNLLAHHTSRNPRIEVGKNNIQALIDIRNNVIYNWGFNAIYGGDTSSVNIINNYFKPGPGTNYNVRERIINPSAGITGVSKWYISGNVLEGYEDITKDNMKGVIPDEKAPYEILKEPIIIPGEVRTTSADVAYEEVLRKAGAVYPKRDAVDARIVNEVRKGIGRFINNEREVGGYPELRSIEPPLDTDNDGMPDDWEIKNGLNPKDSSDGKIIGQDGYSNLERYLNSLVDMNYEPTNPDVEIVSPKFNNIYSVGSIIEIKVEASAKNGEIVKVEFYDGDLKIGEDSVRPYVINYKISEGTHFISARAIDSNGLSTQASTVIVHGVLPQIGLPWRKIDIGNVAIKGRASLTEDGKIILRGAGAIKGSEDSFFFCYQPLVGDGELTAKLEDVEKIDQDGVFAGLMIRKELTPKSPFALIAGLYTKAERLISPQAIFFITRKKEGEKIVLPPPPPAKNDKPEYKLETALYNIRFPYYIKIKREGNKVIGLASSDGNRWIEVGSINFDKLPKVIYIGFAIDAGKGLNDLSKSYIGEFSYNDLDNYHRAVFSEISLIKK
jgi:pectate lyase